MRLRLWGTRGSIPSPARADEIETKIKKALFAAAEAGVDLSNPTAVRAFVSNLPYAIRGTAGGDTACVEVRSAGNLLIFDCGSGMRQLGVELMKQEFARGQGVAHIFISHTHWDHMMGWPFFVPSFIPGNRLIIHGIHPDLEQRFRHQQTNPSMFPISLDYHAAHIEFVTHELGGIIQIGETRISTIRFDHLGDAFGYRIEDADGILVYATDSEYKSLDPEATQHVVEFFRDADALIFDAMFSLRESYQKEDWGHSSALAGADLATRAAVRRLLLFHHDPYASDEQIWNLRDIAEGYIQQHPERPPCEVIVGYDGFELEVWGEAELKVSTEQLKEGIAIHLNGRLVEDTAPVAREAIEKAAKQGAGQRLVIDLTEVNHLDHNGLNTLFTARRRWRPVAMAGLSSELRRTLTEFGALDYFSVFDTPQNALLALKQGSEIRSGHLLGARYKIQELIGRGTLGDLYRATDLTVNRQVTILVICPSLGKASIDTLLKAAASATRLRHPMIADIYEVAQEGPINILAMEYVPGRSLRQLLPTTKESSDVTASRDTLVFITPAQAVRIGAQIAQVLEYAHSRNVAHGALNPENIILQEDGSVKITNFGVGRVEIDRPLTDLPAHLGSIDYLAPEQLQGYGNSRLADLYALGAILYEILTGEPPFSTSDSREDLISLQLRQQPVPPRRRNPNLSRSLENLVLHLLQKLPQDRPASTAAVRQTLVNLYPRLSQKPLVGRDVERDQLRHHLERVAQGQSGFLVVRGGTGTGKSRLALSFVGEKAAGKTVKVLYAMLFAFEDARPYKLFADLLRHTLLDLPAHETSQLLGELGELSHPLTVLIPELRPAMLAYARTDVECERLEEAICETVRLMTRDAPVMLILDSVQWIDVASLGLLNRLVQQRIPRLLIVALYRTEEVDQDRPLHTVLSELDSWIDETLDIQALGPIEVHQITSALNAQVPSDFGLWLYSETEGNPLHIEQVLLAYLENRSDIRHPLERSTGMTIEDAILRRLEGLSSEGQMALRQAAVLGHSFTLDKLRLALSQSEQQVLDCLDTSLQAGLIYGHPSEDRYSFTHPLVREVIYADMLGGVRKRYHFLAARVLEQEGISGTLDERIDVLAHHYSHAGDYEKALHYWARAIRRARQLHAFGSALNYVNQAVKAVEQLSRTAVTDRERDQRQKQRGDLLAARTDLEAKLAQQA